MINIFGRSVNAHCKKQAQSIALDTTAISTPFSDSLFHLSLRTGKASTSYPTLTRAYATIAKGSYTLRQMRMMFLNTVNANDRLRLGIYDANGDLLQKTNRFAPYSNAIHTEPLINTVDIVGGALYYVAWSIVSSAPGNTFFPVFGLGDTLTENPLVQLSDPNEFPSHISQGPLVSGNRVWLGWTA